MCDSQTWNPPTTTTTTGCVCQRPNLLTERKRREEGEQERKRRREDDSELLTGFRSADKVRALLLSAPLFLKISVLPPHLCLHVCSLINFSVTMWQEFKCRGYSCQKPKRQIREKELTAPVHIVLLLTIFNAATRILWFQLRMMRRT